MAYRFNLLDDRELLWQNDYLFNVQPVFPLIPEDILELKSVEKSGATPPASQEVVVEKPTVYEGPVFATPSLFTLDELDGTNGFTIDGITDGGFLGWSVSGIGDVNDDGIDDFAVGAINGGGTTQGAVYVVFGNDAGFPANFDLSTLNGANGFSIEGINSGDQLGVSISAVGDMNADGIDDFVIGAQLNDDGTVNAGSAYVIFGAPIFDASFDLAALDGITGFAFEGSDIGGQAGAMVTGLGDINGDGINDVMIGAPFGGPNDEGEAYVIFGSFTTFFGTYDRSFLTGFEGFIITGLNADDNLGFAAAEVGDFNGDGIDDFLISAPRQDVGATVAAGQVFLVFGNQSGFGASLDLSIINGTAGITFDGLNFADLTGDAVSGVGDINADGMFDILIGAHSIGNDEGGAYVVFGTTSTFATSFDLSTLDGTNGFFIQGLEPDGATGFSVSDAGDFNGDGIDDLVVAAPDAGRSFPNEDNGAIFIIFGTAGGFTASIDLNSLDGTNGTRIDGINFGDEAGYSVSNAGDVNGDGMSDLLIGAPRASTGLFDGNGQSYIVYGYDPTLLPSPPVAEDDGFTTDEATPIGGNVLADNGNGADSDADGDTLSVLEINGDISLVGQQFAGDNGGLFTVLPDGTMSFDPNGDFEYLNPLTDAFTGFSYTVSDGTGSTDTAFVSVQVSGLNDGPTAVPDDLFTNADNDLILSVFGDNGAGFTDDDPDGDFVVSEVNGLLANVGSVVAGSNGGTFLIYAHGGMVFQPGTDFAGLVGAATATTTATYTIDDGFGGTDTTTVTVTVSASGTNIDPIAQIDELGTDASTDLAGNVFWDNGNGHDRDDNGDALTVSSVAGDGFLVGTPIAGDAGGLFVINADGSYTFTPNGEFTGLSGGQFQDTSVTYSVDDGNGGFSEAFVTVRVFSDGSLLDVPTARDDFFNTDQGTTVTGSVLTDNGTGPDEGSNIVGSVNDQFGNVGLAVAGDTGGTFTINSDGTFSFDPGTDFNGLAAGETALTSVSYRLNGGDEDSNTATLVVLVTGAAGVNNPPVANDDAFTVNEDSNISTGDLFADNGNGADSDADGDTFVVSLINGQTFTNGSVFFLNGGALTPNSNGTFDFTTSGFFDYLGVGEQFDNTFTYTIDDGNGGTDTATATITVTGVNDAPIGFDPATQSPPVDPLDYIPAQAVDDGAAITDLDLSPYFSDPDTNDTLTITVDIAALPTGLLYDLATNTITGTPAASASQDGPNNDGIYPVQITASDGNGGTFVTFVTFNVSNPAPIAEDDNLSTNEATAINGSVFADNGVNPDSDPDGDVLIVSEVDNNASNVGIAVAGSTGGLFTINSDGTFDFNPNGDFDTLGAGDSNDTTVTYTISDGEGGFSTATVTVTVNGLNPVNTAPVANDDAFTTDEDNAVGGNIFDDNGGGVDDDADGDNFSVSHVGGVPGNVGQSVVGSNGGLFIIQANGVFSFQPNGDFDSLAVGQSDTSTMTYTIDDGNGGTSTATVTVTINGVNDAPIAMDDTLVGDPDFNTFNLFADNGNGADTDPDGDPLVITQINGVAVQTGSDVVLQSGLTVHFNGVGEIELRTLQPGEYNETFTYTVSDGQGGTDTATVNAEFSVDFVDLADVNEFGLAINGVAAGDESGFAVSSAGDVNGDGFDDFMIGAHFAGPNANGDPGATYVIFGGLGRPAPQGESFDLSNIDGSNGFVLTGIDQFDNSGWSIAAPGDVNGDGIDDILISGHLADPNNGQSGEVYVVFGGQNFGASFDLGSLNGTNGFVLNGIDAIDQAGYEVAGLGDLNGDGINDFMIGARGADTVGDNHTGEAYVVFGSANGFDPVFELADLDGSNGFTIAGVTSEGFLGAGLAATPGDFDGDGINDALIGIPGVDGQPGQVMILFGNDGGFDARVDADNLSGLGILISGIDPGGQLGFDLTGLGDVNSDGIDDFALAAPFADPGGLTDAGEVYIVFGGTDVRSGVDLSALDGTNGFVISGDQAGLEFGFSVGAAGDFDGDGIDDFIIGGPSANGTGGAVLIYGNANGFPANFDIDSMNANELFFIGGVAAGDDVGFAVTGVGDIDGDGFDDILVGAPGADANGNADSGQSFILPGFSRTGVNPAEVIEKTIISEVFTGDGSGNAVVSEAPPADKTGVSEDDSFAFIEKAIVSDDDIGLNGIFGEFQIDQDILAEFMAQVQMLRETNFHTEAYVELSADRPENDLSLFTDFFNFL